MAFETSVQFLSYKKGQNDFGLWAYQNHYQIIGIWLVLWPPYGQYWPNQPQRLRYYL